MDQRQKMKHIEIENVVFWKWVNSSILALVTASSVYHLNIENTNQNEVKVMDRGAALMNG
jgi:clathrin heavy chain